MTAQFQFVMRSGPTPGTTFAVEGDLVTLGRDSSNSIVINDAEISRRHARLTAQGGKYVLEDLGSTNGTFVNGQRISGQYVLKPGDVLSFGEQISLMYEAVNFDPAATVASPRSAMPSGGASSGRQSAPAAPPPPSQGYAGQVPSGPGGPGSQPGQPAKKNNTTVIIIAVLALLILCGCIGFLWWVDATYRWCTFFPFLAGCG
jgi:cobalamin biosynthesis Mg chelatase CobN